MTDNMKNMYDDELNKLSMADESDDYDEYEEEVIERDEEYDDGDDEEYEEEYDDEEYDDEEPYDEEYDDYDEGYDDQYYDDRLNQVLDELAELKRGMANPPAVQQPQPYPGIQPHILFGFPQQNNNEVVMYNEISRLRDELSKTQNSQSMHEELSRLKEEMERDKRQNEAQFLSEIKRLNERVEELQQPEKRPALAGGQPAALLSEGQSNGKELGKLLGINETLLRSTRDSDAKILSEIAEVKNKLEAVSVSAELDKALAGVRESLDLLKARPECANINYSDALTEISASVAALKTAIGESAGSTVDKKLINKLSRIKTDGGKVDLTEIMRSVYELKGMLGSSDPNQQSLVNMSLKTYTELDLLHATIANSSDFRMKLEAVENFAASVNAQDFITADAICAYDIVLKELMDTQLDRGVFDSLCSFATATGKITIPAAKKDAVNKYLAFAERVRRENLDSVIEFLPEMISAVNDAEGTKNVTAVSGIYDDILSANSARANASEADKHTVEAEVKALINELASLTVGDIVSYSPAMPLPTSDAVTFSEGDSVSDRLDYLIRAVNEMSAAIAAAPAKNAAASDDVAATSQQEVVVGDVSAANVTEELEQLRAMLTALSAKVDLDEFESDIRGNLTNIIGRLSSIENRLSDGQVENIAEVVPERYDDQTANFVSEDIVSAIQTGDANISDDISARAAEIVDQIGGKLEGILSAEDKEQVFADLAEIKEKIARQDELAAQINDLRADIIALPESVNPVAQFDKLYDDIATQFDKLYDDLSAVDGDIAEKLTVKLDEVKAAVDGLSASDLSGAVLDGIVDFRTAYEENRELSSADRAKLLEDIAFVRAEVERRLGEQVDGGVENQDIVDKLDGLQAQFTESMGALETMIADLQVAGNESADRFTAYEESGRGIAEAQQGISAAIDELKEKSAALEDMINANGLLAADNQNVIVDDLNRILEQLTPPSDGEQVESNAYDEIVAISAKADEMRNAFEQSNGEILSALAEIKEQVHLKELEQSLEAVSATEEEQNKLLNEIAALRERLSGLESAQQDQTESLSAQLGMIADSIAGIAVNNSSDEADNMSDIVRMQDDITFIRNQIEANIETTPEEDNLSDTLASEGLSLIMDDIASIKEKLASLDEYDTVAEILSLREDVKTARILDNNDVAAELEGLKGDLMELKADVSDIKAIRSDGESVVIGSTGAPTSDEVNMLLSEIVSLRDEIQSYKDDVTNIVSTQDDIQPATAVADENISVILDELTGLHNEIDNIKIENLAEQAGEIDDIKNALSEIKDMISRRTTIADDGVERDSAVSNELNVVLDEIINVKGEVEALKIDMVTANETAAAERESDAQAEKAAFADEMQAFKNELYAMIGEKLEELSAVSPDVGEELRSVKDQLADLQALAVGGIAIDDESGRSAESNVKVDLSEVNGQLADIRDRLANMPATSEVEPDTAVLGEVLSLREEIAAMREQMSAAPSAVSAEPDTALLEEVLSLRDEVSALREQLAAAPVAVEPETDTTLLNEILGLREELERMREGASSSDENAVIMESIDAIKEDVRAIKEEPDLSIINEVLALRDEFQAFKDEMDKMRSAPREDKSKEELVAEVQSLRDQLFAISMANVNDGTSNEVVYESYNNIILDEISALRDEIALIKQADETGAISEELASMKDKLTNLAVDDSEKTEARFDEIRKELAALKASSDTVDNNVILNELAALKEELANQREADATTLNFMSEMAHLLERQNVYISQASNERLSDEIETLKSEIASSLSVPVAGDDIRSEFEGLKAELARNRAATVTVDNSAVLKELASLREEINKKNSSNDSKTILREIARLKDEIGAIAERDNNDDGALSRSISDLKTELNQLAGFVEETPETAPAPKKSSSSRAKSGKSSQKSGSKSTAKRKSPAKPKQQPLREDNGLTSDNLISKIDATTINLGGSAEDVFMLNPDFEPESIPATSEEMDIASRIAKQVANKLIMEQLVQQLGDGNVPNSEVEEIVKDILPQEFTTIQVDEQTDKVRRLANSLVLDKLRSRLKK